MKEEKVKNNLNQFTLDGNVAGIGTPYKVLNEKMRMRFDLGQTRNGKTQFVPIVLPTKLVEIYGDKIEKGNWITVRGSINSYNKKIMKNDKEINSKEIDIIAFEIEDKKLNKIFKSDGTIIDKDNNKGMER